MPQGVPLEQILELVEQVDRPHRRAHRSERVGDEGSEPLLDAGELLFECLVVAREGGGAMVEHIARGGADVAEGHLQAGHDLLHPRNAAAAEGRVRLHGNKELLEGLQALSECRELSKHRRLGEAEACELLQVLVRAVPQQRLPLPPVFVVEPHALGEPRYRHRGWLVEEGALLQEVPLAELYHLIADLYEQPRGALLGAVAA
mmetsp:Transcript_71368/g.225406  ORF Transcript_71368/g.225406 Transcript_71368/m.225406 type:complete len:203 (-) Transcript_71368:579-1187(-)